MATPAKYPNRPTMPLLDHGQIAAQAATATRKTLAAITDDRDRLYSAATTARVAWNAAAASRAARNAAAVDLWAHHQVTNWALCDTVGVNTGRLSRILVAAIAPHPTPYQAGGLQGALPRTDMGAYRDLLAKTGFTPQPDVDFLVDRLAAHSADTTRHAAAAAAARDVRDTLIGRLHREDGLTQNLLSSMTGVQPDQISRWLSRNPPPA